MKKAVNKCEGLVAPVRTPVSSRLAQWPCRIELVPTQAPYLDGANLLIAADCSAYAYANFHADMMHNHITLIGCPKSNPKSLTEKLTAIIMENEIKSVRLVRMEVTCCTSLETAVKHALRASQKTIPWQVITITTDGKIAE